MTSHAAPIQQATQPQPSSPGAQLPSLSPDIRLYGNVNEHMLGEFFRQQSEASLAKPLVLELSTSGGDADIGRRIALEVRLWREKSGRDVYFLGKSFVYSAGVTIMSGFPVNRRFITADTLLLIHERKMKKTVEFNGALRGCLSLANDLIAQIESGQMLERQGFEQLVEGTQLTVDDVLTHVLNKDWYLTADEALAVDLVGGIV